MPPTSTIHAAAATIAPPRAALSHLTVRMMSSFRGARSSEGRAHLARVEGGDAVAGPGEAADEEVGEVQEPNGARADQFLGGGPVFLWCGGPEDRIDARAAHSAIGY